jgi:hypothetical protein
MKKYFTLSKLLFIVAAPITILLLPVNFFDSGKSICLSTLLFDTECYACGLTRGMMHLVHFDFMNAYAYNPLSFVVFIPLTVVWIQWFLKERKALKAYQNMG